MELISPNYFINLQLLLVVGELASIKKTFRIMHLNHLSLVLGILVVATIEALDTSNSRFPTLVLMPSKCNPNYLSTSRCPLCMFWKKERDPTF
jgi:hypothetical protein